MSSYTSLAEKVRVERELARQKRMFSLPAIFFIVPLIPSK
jgi:hypothetical protein